MFLMLTHELLVDIHVRHQQGEKIRIAGQIFEAWGDAAQVLQSTVNRFRWSVAGANAVKVSKDTLGLFFSVVPSRVTSVSSRDKSAAVIIFMSPCIIVFPVCGLVRCKRQPLADTFSNFSQAQCVAHQQTGEPAAFWYQQDIAASTAPGGGCAIVTRLVDGGKERE